MVQLSSFKSLTLYQLRTIDFLDLSRPLPLGCWANEVSKFAGFNLAGGTCVTETYELLANDASALTALPLKSEWLNIFNCLYKFI